MPRIRFSHYMTPLPGIMPRAARNSHLVDSSSKLGRIAVPRGVPCRMLADLTDARVVSLEVDLHLCLAQQHLRHL